MWLGALARGAALAYAFSPVRAEITGMGTIEPVFEELVVPTNRWACVVTKVFVSPGQQVEPGTPLFEWITDGEWVVASTGASAMIKPAFGSPPPARHAEARPLYQRSFERAEALRRWSTSTERPREWAGAPRATAQPSHRESRRSRDHGWESLLQQRLNARVNREDDIAMEEARASSAAVVG